VIKKNIKGAYHWSIVESRRVNGKPRPVILEYLGTAEALLKRLTEGVPKKVRSYSHGAVAVMLDMDALPSNLIARIEENIGFTGSAHTLLEKLSEIRLATFIESPPQKTKGRYKANYRLEEMDPDIYELAEAMNVTDLKLKSNIPFSVYN